MKLTKSRFTPLVLALAGLAAIPAGADDSGRSRASSYQAKNMFAFGSPATLLPGAATLIRTEEGISYRVNTSMLMAGAHTIWIVIFNRPENCAAGSGACMPPDLANPAVKGSVVAGAGYIVGLDGIANFEGSLSEGVPPQGIQVNVPSGTVDGLKNSRKAEIHLVIRAHGPTAAGNAVIQLTTFETCVGCANVQAAAFEAVQ